MVTTNLPFDEWPEAFRSERLTGALLTGWAGGGDGSMGKPPPWLVGKLTEYRME